MAAQRLVGRFSSSPMVKLDQRPPSTASQYSTIKKEMSFSLSNTTAATAVASSVNSSKPSRKLPVLLFDIMDTIVRDPFYHDVPAFFGMSMKELLECKHPTAWIEFEKGLINEFSKCRCFWVSLEPLLGDFRPLLRILRDGSLSCSSTSEDKTDASVS
ncbi:UNVERIFIED_CONTAM: Flavin mononucleotide hydrolase 1, chloroplatic [Sesamum calycinum]|uniref:Flavin mononucleotide hydrolase 1, chloroplatic n=1 Tax=Sesamum calycinum TaxID=2727403 RepID=A0AAW2LIA8_9LAMI